MHANLPNVTLDHCVIHVSEWERSNRFYTAVLGAELVERNGAWAYRFGTEQLNVHGPGLNPDPVARVPVAPVASTSICAAAIGAPPAVRSRPLIVWAWP